MRTRSLLQSAVMTAVCVPLIGLARLVFCVWDLTALARRGTTR